MAPVLKTSSRWGGILSGAGTGMGSGAIAAGSSIASASGSGRLLESAVEFGGTGGWDRVFILGGVWFMGVLFSEGVWVYG